MFVFLICCDDCYVVETVKKVGKVSEKRGKAVKMVPPTIMKGNEKASTSEGDEWFGIHMLLCFHFPVV